MKDEEEKIDRSHLLLCKGREREKNRSSWYNAQGILVILYGWVKQGKLSDASQVDLQLFLFALSHFDAKREKTLCIES